MEIYTNSHKHFILGDDIWKFFFFWVVIVVVCLFCYWAVTDNLVVNITCLITGSVSHKVDSCFMREII